MAPGTAARAAIDHVNLVVADLERSATFYERLLGLRRTFERRLEGEWLERVTGLPGAVADCIFLEGEGACHMELLHYICPATGKQEGEPQPYYWGIRHLAFVVDDPAPVQQRLAELGVTPLSPPVKVPFVLGARGAKQLFYFHDPDGVIVEITSYAKAAGPGARDEVAEVGLEPTTPRV